MTDGVIRTDKAPKPAASYSQARRKGNILQLAGQVGFEPATGKLVDGGVAEQTKQVFSNLEALLTEAGASWSDVVMMRVYLTDTSHFAELNATYNALVTEPYPARTTVYVDLPEGILVEIDALAVLG